MPDNSHTTDIFQHIYDGENNFSLSCFWDAGITLKIGDEMNGFEDEKHFDNFYQLDEYLKQRFR